MANQIQIKICIKYNPYFINSIINMKKGKNIFLCSLMLISFSFYPLMANDGKDKNNVTAGPESGSLVIVGGAMKDSNIVLKFIELAGGKDAAFVVIPTASGADSIDPQKYIRFLSRFGVKNIQVLHTYNPEIANTEEFIAPLKKANAVWFGGGRQWRLVDAYANTLTEIEIRKVLDRGGVIGGSSAGATIQGTFLARGDTKTNRIMMGDHQKGFNYLKESVIDQHLLVRNRQFDLIEILETHPGLLGIGLDENTAIIVQGNKFEVIGKSFVAIYDTDLWEKMEKPDNKFTLPNQGKFFLLRAGDKYDMEKRKVFYWNGSNREISTDK